MLKRTIKYEDFDGNIISEDFTFHISKSELLEMDIEHKEGLGAILDEIIKTDDKKGLVVQFKKIILAAYCQRYGNRFVKSPELTEAFSQTPAFDALFMELVTDDEAASVFVQGIIPRDLNAAAQKISTTEVAAAPSALPAPPAPTHVDL
jgi:hypothetical protein